jgi:crotonobetainyl-CoA:carnitine CoA-transferase CaiB-like acyl-CoA transferase
VIKVEHPKGEELRLVPPLIGGESGPFMMWNRNKRCITLDLTE